MFCAVDRSVMLNICLPEVSLIGMRCHQWLETQALLIHFEQYLWVYYGMSNASASVPFTVFVPAGKMYENLLIVFSRKIKTDFSLVWGHLRCIVKCSLHEAKLTVNCTSKIKLSVKLNCPLNFKFEIDRSKELISDQCNTPFF